MSNYIYELMWRTIAVLFFNLFTLMIVCLWEGVTYIVDNTQNEEKKLPETMEESIDFLLNHPDVKIGKVTNPIKNKQVRNAKCCGNCIYGKWLKIDCGYDCQQHGMLVASSCVCDYYSS